MTCPRRKNHRSLKMRMRNIFCATPMDALDPGALLAAYCVFPVMCVTLPVSLPSDIFNAHATFCTVRPRFPPGHLFFSLFCFLPSGVSAVGYLKPNNVVYCHWH